jgi:WD40 repeat protein
MEQHSAVHRTIVVVDVERFGDLARTNDHQVAVRGGLYDAVEQAFAEAGISWLDCTREDRGDGILILVPPGVAKSRLVDPLPDRLVAALRRHNARSSFAAQIRLRVALDAGEVRYDARGVTGEAINRAFRLLDAPALKSALATSTGALALITSDWFYHETVRHEPAAAPETYRAVRVRVKETDTQAWICLPDDSVSSQASSQPAAASIHWGETPPRAPFYGRGREIKTLRRWIVDDDCRIIAVLGMGGMGKTTLAAWVADEVKDGFDYVYWCSVYNAQPLSEVLEGFVRYLSGGAHATLPNDPGEQIDILLTHLRANRCLIILDNLETLFHPGTVTGQYLHGYESYGLLLRTLATADHRSQLVLTSREKPSEIAPLESGSGPVRVLHLAGLTDQVGRRLLADCGLTAPAIAGSALVERYAGSPLELKLASGTITRLFGGDITTFLAEETSVVGGTYGLLDGQFGRMSPLEQSVMYWLAIHREPATLDELRAATLPPSSKRELIATLESLANRSMAVVAGAGRFSAQPVITEFVTERFLDQLYQEVTGAEVILLRSHALVQATAKGYLREAQIRVLLDPLATRLRDSLGRDQVQDRLARLLNRLRDSPTGAVGYAPANVLHLLIHLDLDPSACDFSGLHIRQAYLQAVSLPNANFRMAHFTQTLFTDTFGIIDTIAASPDGNLVAAGTRGGDVRIWNIEDGSPVVTWHEHTDSVWCVAFSDNGEFLASASGDRTVRIWDLRTRRCVQVCHGHHESVFSVAFQPGTSVLATASQDNTARLWNTLSGHELFQMQHDSWVRAVAFSGNGRHLASCSLDGTVRVWDVATGSQVAIFQDTRDNPSAVTISPMGDLVAAGCYDGTIKIWHWPTGQKVLTVRGHGERVFWLDFSADADLLVSASGDRTIRLWDVATGQLCRVFAGHRLAATSVTFVPGRDQIASGGDDQTVRLWDRATGDCLRLLQGHEQSLHSVACSRDSALVASGGDDTEIRLWDVTTGTCLRRLRGHTHWVQVVTFSPDGTRLASTGDDRTVRLWDTHSGQCLQVFHGHTGWVADVAFSPDGSLVVSGGTHRLIRIWDVATGKTLHPIEAYASAVGALAFTSDGTTLISGGHDHSHQIKLWDTTSWTHMVTLSGQEGAILDLAITPDDEYLITVGADGLVHVWDLPQRQHRNAMEAHLTRVTCVACHPIDNRLVATGSDDRTIRLWAIGKATCIQTLRGHTQGIASIDFTPDGTSLVSASIDGTIRIWNLGTGACQAILVPDRPYQGMDITGARGLTEAQREALRTLGAVDQTTD